MLKGELSGYASVRIDKKNRLIFKDSEARILEEAVESSYRKGGINACIGEQEVSKETVMNKLHTLEFPLLEPLKEKRKVSRLYIDADEDHVSLQYLEKKGDIKKPRVNTVMPKLIYVYEDVNFDGSKHEPYRHYGGYTGCEAPPAGQPDGAVLRGSEGKDPDRCGLRCGLSRGAS